MRANKFNITFHAQDFDATKQFYHEILQLEYLHGWDRDDGRGAIFALTDQSEIEFFAPPYGQAQTEGQPKDIKLALLVEDVDAEYERLKDQVALIDEIGDRAWGDRSFGFTDPNGVIIYIFQRVSSALANQ